MYNFRFLKLQNYALTVVWPRPNSRFFTFKIIIKLKITELSRANLRFAQQIWGCSGSWWLRESKRRKPLSGQLWLTFGHPPTSDQLPSRVNFEKTHSSFPFVYFTTVYFIMSYVSFHDFQSLPLFNDRFFGRFWILYICLAKSCTIRTARSKFCSRLSLKTTNDKNVKK